MYKSSLDNSNFRNKSIEFCIVLNVYGSGPFIREIKYHTNVSTNETIVCE